MYLTKRSKQDTTLRLVYCSMLVALCYIGALVKIQGSIAFDSMPAYFAALFLGPYLGAIVGFLGHLLTSITSGFPLTLPMHIIIAFEMAFFVFAFGWVYKRSNVIVASVVATILNGPIAALLVVPVSLMLKLPSGWEIFYASIIPLTIISAANIILAAIVYRAIGKRLK